jgi:putative PIN family toxin of toxin-antitoxin system
MKVVIDTNVLVSAVLKDRDPEKVVLYVASQPDLEWIVSPQILKEYKDVLGRDVFGLPLDVLQAWFFLLDALTVIVDTDLAIEFPRDRKDAPFLACALAADADYLITGDRDFSEAQKLLKTTILSVSQFIRLVMK